MEREKFPSLLSFIFSFISKLQSSLCIYKYSLKHACFIMFTHDLASFSYYFHSELKDKNSKCLNKNIKRFPFYASSVLESSKEKIACYTQYLQYLYFKFSLQDIEIYFKK